jgi:hypothetical protein
MRRFAPFRRGHGNGRNLKDIADFVNGIHCARAVLITARRRPLFLADKADSGAMRVYGLEPDLGKRLQCMPDRDDLNDADSQANNRVSVFRL